MEPLPPALHYQRSSEKMGLEIPVRRTGYPRADGHGPGASGGLVSNGGARHLAAVLPAHRCPRLKCACSNDLKGGDKKSDTNRRMPFRPLEKITLCFQIRLPIFDRDKVSKSSLVFLDFIRRASSEDDGFYNAQTIRESSHIYK